jgi:hypothetical protein
MLEQTYNPRTQEAEAGRLWVGGQPGLYNETISKKKKISIKKKSSYLF